MRRKNALYLNDHLEKIDSVNPLIPPKKYYHIYQLYSCLVDKRDDLINHLAENGVMSKIYFDPVHLTHFYRKVLKYECKLPVTEEITKKIVTLPMYPSMTKSELDIIINAINDFYD